MDLLNSFSSYIFPLFLGLSVGVLFEYSKAINGKYNILGSWNFYFLFICTLISAWFGSKILFILTSNNTNLNLSLTFFLGGGFVFYGGLLGGLLWLSLFTKVKPNIKNISCFLPGVIFAHSVGRIGCFLSGCCFGNFCFLPFIDRWPTQLIESAFLFGLGVFLHKKAKNDYSNIFSIYLLSYSIFRFFLEFLRGDKVRGVWSIGLSTSQIISIGVFFVGLVVYLKDNFSTNSSET